MLYEFDADTEIPGAVKRLVLVSGIDGTLRGEEREALVPVKK